MTGQSGKDYQPHRGVSEGNTPIPSTEEYRDNPNAPVHLPCGFPLDTYACRHYHQVLAMEARG